MGLNLEYSGGQTPVDADELVEIRIKTISTRKELDEFEQKNIEQAMEWALKRKFPIDEILTEKFILDVHRKMFGDVWKWAGTIRRTNKNIGVDKFQIQIELRKLLDDCKCWIECGEIAPDEIAIRFKHRLVSTHIFPNGNGRHSRLCADILISHGFNRPVFTWGNSSLSKNGEDRRRYLDAIYQADKGVIEPLIEFSRSS
jgi:Fic-DOC domain mobile mystery protein B